MEIAEALIYVENVLMDYSENNISTDLQAQDLLQEAWDVINDKIITNKNTQSA
jgi:hypothetical protein